MHTHRDVCTCAGRHAYLPMTSATWKSDLVIYTRIPKAASPFSRLGWLTA